MYDINRSNMLSVETLKMYLYDISLLGNAKAGLDEKIDALTEEKESYGKKREFNSWPFFRRKIEVWDFIGAFFATEIVIAFILIVALIAFTEEMEELLLNKFRIMTIIERGRMEFVTYMTVLACICGIACAVAYCLYRYYKNFIKKIREDKARRIFDEEERYRLERENIEIQRIDTEFSELQQKAARIQNEISAQFKLDILHETYQDTEACGIMFQLLDTGRVDTLIDAMNMYEDLKWKSEMKEMLQSMLEKASQIIKQQKNMEHYAKYIMSNQQQINRILHGIAINQYSIARNDQAIELNTAVIASNTNVMSVLDELGVV